MDLPVPWGDNDESSSGGGKYEPLFIRAMIRLLWNMLWKAVRGINSTHEQYKIWACDSDETQLLWWMITDLLRGILTWQLKSHVWIGKQSTHGGCFASGLALPEGFRVLLPRLSSQSTLHPEPLSFIGLLNGGSMVVSGCVHTHDLPDTTLHESMFNLQLAC